MGGTKKWGARTDGRDIAGSGARADAGRNVASETTRSAATTAADMRPAGTDACAAKTALRRIFQALLGGKGGGGAWKGAGQLVTSRAPH